MKISNIHIVTDKKNTTLVATIQFNGENPEELFFSVDTRFANFMHHDASAFLASMLMPSMKKKKIFVLRVQFQKNWLRHKEKFKSYF